MEEVDALLAFCEAGHPWLSHFSIPLFLICLNFLIFLTPSLFYKYYSSSFSYLSIPLTSASSSSLAFREGRLPHVEAPSPTMQPLFGGDIQYFTKFKFNFGTSQSSELPLLPVLALLLKSLRPFRPRRNKPNVFDLMMKPSVLILRQINQMCNSKLCRNG